MTNFTLNRRLFLSGLVSAGGTTVASRVLAATDLTIGGEPFVALSDGYFEFPPEMWVGASDAERDALGNPVRVGANAYLRRTGDRVFMIDSGAGNAPFITNQFKNVGKVPAELADVGVAPEEVTDIVITHMHPDHVGGVVYDGALTFPNAAIHIDSAEWNFWTREGFATEAPEQMRPMVESIQSDARLYANNVVLHDGESDLGGGVTMLPAYGHTPGHNAVLIELGSERLLVLGDTVVSDHIHFEHPNVGWALDADPAAAEATRRRLLDMAVTDNLVVAANHVTAPGVGRVQRKDDAFEFIAL